MWKLFAVLCVGCLALVTFPVGALVVAQMQLSGGWLALALTLALGTQQATLWRSLFIMLHVMLDDEEQRRRRLPLLLQTTTRETIGCAHCPLFFFIVAMMVTAVTHFMAALVIFGVLARWSPLWTAPPAWRWSVVASQAVYYVLVPFEFSFAELLANWHAVEKRRAFMLDDDP